MVSAPSGAAAAIAKEALNFDESKFKAFGISVADFLYNFSSRHPFANQRWRKEEETIETSASADIQRLIAQKSAPFPNLYAVVPFYINAVNRRASETVVDEAIFKPVTESEYSNGFIEHPSGLRASVYRSAEGDTVLVFNGIAKPNLLAWLVTAMETCTGKYEAPFEKAHTFSSGIREIFLAMHGLHGKQTKAAQAIYKELLADEKTTKLHVIGYSMGSIFANNLAGTYGAHVSIFANLGIQETEPTQFRENIAKKVTTIIFPGDPFETLIGSTGLSKTSDDNKIVLTKASNLHVPEEYCAEIMKVAEKEKIKVTPPLPYIPKRLLARVQNAGSVNINLYPKPS